MQKPWEVLVLRALRYGFFTLAVLTAVLFILQMTSHLGLHGDQPFVRTKTIAVANPAPTALNTASGAEIRQYRFDRAGVALRRFQDRSELLQAPVLLYFALYAALWILAAGVFYQLARLFGQWARGGFFHPANVGIIRRVALGVLLFPAFYTLSGMALRPLFERQVIMVTGFTIDALLLFVGFALLLSGVAALVRRGTELQLEQDLTV